MNEKSEAYDKAALAQQMTNERLARENTEQNRVEAVQAARVVEDARVQLNGK